MYLLQVAQMTSPSLESLVALAYRLRKSVVSWGCFVGCVSAERSAIVQLLSLIVWQLSYDVAHVVRRASYPYGQEECQYA